MAENAEAADYERLRGLFEKAMVEQGIPEEYRENLRGMFERLLGNRLVIRTLVCQTGREPQYTIMIDSKKYVKGNRINTNSSISIKTLC